MRTILSADIGATNSRFALFTLEAPDKELSLVREQWFTGAEYPAFRDVLQALRAVPSCSGQSTAAAAPASDKSGADPFLQPGDRIDLAVIAPAGPVKGESCRASNIPWTIHAAEAREELDTDKVFLINDFVAQGYACLMPDRIRAAPVLPGTAVPGAPIAVTGAGTGCGKALLLAPAAPGRPGAEHPLPHEALVLPSEGGHVEFPFVGKEEYAFAEYLREYTGQRSLIADMVVSGSGLAHIYAYLSGERLPPKEASARAVDHSRTLEWFARFYGRMCRNYVLDTLALGGLYITGGMALRVPVLTHPAFAREFFDSAAQEQLLRQIPVYHVQNPQAGLWGAALYGVLRDTGRISGKF